MTCILPLVEKEMHLLSRQILLARSNISTVHAPKALRTARYLNIGIRFRVCE